MPTNRRGGNRRRRGLRLPEHNIAFLLSHGHDHFRDLPRGIDDPETREWLRSEWKKPEIKRLVHERMSRYPDGRRASWAALEFGE